MGIVSLQSYRFEGYRIRVAGNGIVAKVIIIIIIVIIIIIIVHMHIVIGIALALIIMCETGENEVWGKGKGEPCHRQLIEAPTVTQSKNNIKNRTHTNMLLLLLQNED